MSTKIYNGYKITTNNIDQIMNLLRQVGESYDAAAKSYFKTIMANLVSDIWDDMKFFPKRLDHEEFKDLKEYSIFTFCDFRIQQRRQKVRMTQRRDPVVDFELSVIIFPDITKNYTLAMVYSENGKFTECFTGNSLVEYYGWWNNTDKPEDVSDQDWLQREKDWREVFTHSDIPARNGLQRCYEDIYGLHVSPSEIVSEFPTFEKRAQRVATDLLLDIYPEKPDESTVGSWYYNAKKWVKEHPDFAKIYADVLGQMTNPTVEQLKKFPEKETT